MRLFGSNHDKEKMVPLCFVALRNVIGVVSIFREWDLTTTTTVIQIFLWGTFRTIAPFRITSRIYAKAEHSGGEALLQCCFSIFPSPSLNNAF